MIYERIIIIRNYGKSRKRNYIIKIYLIIKYILLIIIWNINKEETLRAIILLILIIIKHF